MIDGYENDNSSLQQMESLGLPTGFSLSLNPYGAKQKKGDKKTFYCQICLIELNSMDTMTSHVKGVKHMKKELALDEEKRQKFARGEISRETAEERLTIIPIANPPATKQKVGLPYLKSRGFTCIRFQAQMGLCHLLCLTMTLLSRFLLASMKRSKRFGIQWLDSTMSRLVNNCN